MAGTRNPFEDIEADVNEQDIQHCKNELQKPDRIGIIAGIICVSLFAILGWLIVDSFMVDVPVHHPWYSRLPLIGDKLWTPPVHTQIPVIGQKIHDAGLFKFIGMCVGAIFGWYFGKMIAALIRSGAKQDERNKHKIA